MQCRCLSFKFNEIIDCKLMFGVEMSGRDIEGSSIKDLKFQYNNSLTSNNNNNMTKWFDLTNPSAFQTNENHSKKKKIVQNQFFVVVCRVGWIFFSSSLSSSYFSSLFIYSVRSIVLNIYPIEYFSRK